MTEKKLQPGDVWKHSDPDNGEIIWVIILTETKAKWFDKRRNCWIIWEDDGWFGPTTSILNKDKRLFTKLQ
tara:strand:+ start:19119 stop:19331 length:213 start_codon:yes stop_codon:yes gene_type:complete